MLFPRHSPLQVTEHCKMQEHRGTNHLQNTTRNQRRETPFQTVSEALQTLYTEAHQQIATDTTSAKATRIGTVHNAPATEAKPVHRWFCKAHA